MRALLERLSELTGDKYAEVKDGVMTFFDGIVIPVELIMYQRMPSDGLYIVYDGTCDGKCAIGKPRASCMGRCYSKTKCAVYGVYRVEEDTTVRLSMSDCAKLIATNDEEEV